MLVRKAEALVFLQKAASLTQADESLLDLVHPLAESAMHSYLQQDIGYVRHIEYLPIGQNTRERSYPLDDVDFRQNVVTFVSNRGGGTDLQLKHLPVFLTGLEVRENADGRAGQTQTSFDDDTLLVEGDDYYLDMDSGEVDYSRTGIIRRIGSWPAEPRSVKVSYYGGWSSDLMTNVSAAGAIKLAALYTIASVFWKEKARFKTQGGTYTSERIGQYAYVIGRPTGGAIFAVPQDAKDLLQPFRNYGRVFG